MHRIAALAGLEIISCTGIRARDCRATTSHRCRHRRYRGYGSQRLLSSAMPRFCSARFDAARTQLTDSTQAYTSFRFFYAKVLEHRALRWREVLGDSASGEVLVQKLRTLRPSLGASLRLLRFRCGLVRPVPLASSVPPAAIARHSSAPRPRTRAVLIHGCCCCCRRRYRRRSQAFLPQGHTVGVSAGGACAGRDSWPGAADAAVRRPCMRQVWLHVSGARARMDYQAGLYQRLLRENEGIATIHTELIEKGASDAGRAPRGTAAPADRARTGAMHRFASDLSGESPLQFPARPGRHVVDRARRKRGDRVLASGVARLLVLQQGCRLLPGAELCSGPAGVGDAHRGIRLLDARHHARVPAARVLQCDGPHGAACRLRAHARPVPTPSRSAAT